MHRQRFDRVMERQRLIDRLKPISLKCGPYPHHEWSRFIRKASDQEMRQCIAIRSEPAQIHFIRQKVAWWELGWWDQLWSSYATIQLPPLILTTTPTAGASSSSTPTPTVTATTISSATKSITPTKSDTTLPSATSTRLTIPIVDQQQQQSDINHIRELRIAVSKKCANNDWLEFFVVAHRHDDKVKECYALKTDEERIEFIRQFALWTKRPWWKPYISFKYIPTSTTSANANSLPKLSSPNDQPDDESDDEEEQSLIKHHQE